MSELLGAMLGPVATFQRPLPSMEQVVYAARTKYSNPGPICQARPANSGLVKRNFSSVYHEWNPPDPYASACGRTICLSPPTHLVTTLFSQLVSLHAQEESVLTFIVLLFVIFLTLLFGRLLKT